MTLQLAYPLYFIGLCLLAGAAYAYLLYRNRYFGEQGRFWAFPNWLLALTRFLTVSIIAFLLLSPFIKSYYQSVQKPVVAIAMDNSASIPLNPDSTYYRDTFPGVMEDVINRLEASYEVHSYVFGEEVRQGKRLTFQDRETNLASPLQQVYDQYYNRNLGAVILATDGIYNQGRPPMGAARQLQPPVYTVALGDTIPPKDWRIRRIRHNDIVYAGSKFPVEVQVQAESLPQASTTLTIQKAGKQVYQQSITADGSDFDTTIRAYFTIEEPGLKGFTATLTPRKDEVSKANNSRQFYIEALKSKRQIAVIAQHPHPDVGVIRQALEGRERFKVNTFTLKDWQEKDEALDAYDVVIFHQLPGKGMKGGQLIKRANEKALPSLFMVGNSTSLSGLNQLNLGFGIQPKSRQPNQVQPVLNDRFNAFNVNEAFEKLLPQLPPVGAPHAQYRLNAPSRTLLYQKIGDVKSQKPLFTFLRRPNYKIGLFAGTGLWRWYLNEYRVLEQHKGIPDLLAKTIQYLAVDAEKQQFRLVNQQHQYQENERIRFQAEFYNESYEPVKDADISIAISDQKGNTYDFDFTPLEEGYEVEAGFLPVGQYDFTAKATYGEQTFTRTGAFVVKPVNKEHLSTVANHAMLANLARENNGRIVYPREVEALPEKLKTSGKLKPTAERKYRLQELIHNKSLFGLIALLLTGEWFLRKFYGGY